MILSLAPLAGFTSAPFRRVCHAFGADLTYTEMVSAAGLAHGSSPTRHLMETLPGEGPVVCQLFGAHPEELAYAASEATKLRDPTDPARPRFVGLDLNAGCPMPKIVHEGAGAALVPQPELIHACLKAMISVTDLPVTLKTRPGPRPDQVLIAEILAAAESAGVKGITMHARFTSQKHGGSIHLDLLAELVARAHVPVTGNGGVYNAETFAAMTATGVAGVMIGRAALANPWLFHDLRDPAAEIAHKDPARRAALQDAAYAQHLENVRAFHAQLVREFPNDHVGSSNDFVMAALRTHLFRYFNGRPGAAEYRRQLNAATDPSALVPPAFQETPFS